jgi:hypothetical protein
MDTAIHNIATRCRRLPFVSLTIIGPLGFLRLESPKP